MCVSLSQPNSVVTCCSNPRSPVHASPCASWQAFGGNAGPGNFHDATLEVPIVTRRVDQISLGPQLDRLEFVVLCAVAITCQISNTSLDSASLRAFPFESV